MERQYAVVMTTFGERVRKRRGDRSQEWLAKAVGRTRAAISFWENGTTAAANIAYEEIVRAAKALETTPEYLLTGKGHPGGTIEIPGAGVTVMEDESDFDDQTGVTFPVYDMDVSAGPGIPIAEFVGTRKKLHFLRSGGPRNFYGSYPQKKQTPWSDCCLN